MSTSRNLHPVETTQSSRSVLPCQDIQAPGRRVAATVHEPLAIPLYCLHIFSHLEVSSLRRTSPYRRQVAHSTPAYQNDFAARMNWGTQSYEEANHPPVVKLGHSNELKASKGDSVRLSAEGSTDPDGDALSYNWFYYPEVGTFTISSGTSGQPV